MREKREENRERRGEKEERFRKDKRMWDHKLKRRGKKRKGKRKEEGRERKKRKKRKERNERRNKIAFFLLKFNYYFRSHQLQPTNLPSNVIWWCYSIAYFFIFETDCLSACLPALLALYCHVIFFCFFLISLIILFLISFILFFFLFSYFFVFLNSNHNNIYSPLPVTPKIGLICSKMTSWRHVVGAKRAHIGMKPMSC